MPLIDIAQWIDSVELQPRRQVRHVESVVSITIRTAKGSRPDKNVAVAMNSVDSQTVIALDSAGMVVRPARSERNILLGDWLAGIDVIDVENTIPGELYDQLFEH